MTDLGMALLFHEATGTYNATYSTDYKYDRYWIAHAMSHPLEITGVWAWKLEDDGIPQNTPHVSCIFDIEWYGFDEGADIISTITAPLTVESVGLLAGIVAIRTFLSFSLETEIEGCWPWRRRDRSPGEAR